MANSDSVKDAMAPDPIPQGEQVLNQSPAFTDVNLFTSDTPLREAVAREGAADAADNLAAFGRIAGRPTSIRRGFAPSMPKEGASTVSSTIRPITG
jgi:hypothetical protein